MRELRDSEDPEVVAVGTARRWASVSAMMALSHHPRLMSTILDLTSTHASTAIDFCEIRFFFPSFEFANNLNPLHRTGSHAASAIRYNINEVRTWAMEAMHAFDTIRYRDRDRVVRFWSTLTSTPTFGLWERNTP